MKQDQFDYFCAETYVGIEDIAIDELKKRFGGKCQIAKVFDGFIYFYSNFDLEKFYELKCINSIFLVQKITNELDSLENVKQIIYKINYILRKNRELFDENTFSTFKVTAKNANSREFINLKKSISQHTKLNLVFQGGDLVIKRIDGVYNELRIRITNRPISNKFWRVCNFKAALNSTLAGAMINLTNPQKGDKVLNLCSGSGTLLIERCLTLPYPETALGIEIDPSTYECSVRNVKASRIFKKYKIMNADATEILNHVGEEKFNVFLVDLPFGLSTGNKETNYELYKNILENISYVAEKDSRICLITKDIQNLNSVLLEKADKLEVIKKIRTRVSTNIGVYINPTIYLIRYKS